MISAALSGFSGTRPRPSPVVRLFSFLVPKAEVALSVEVDGVPVPYAEPVAEGEPGMPARPAPPADPAAEAMPADAVDVRLEALAWGRSGDKGDKANIGIITRRADYLPWIWRALTEEAVAGTFAHFLDGGAPRPVERFLMPGTNAINFLLHDALGGGGVASLRNDAQGKGYAQILLDTPIPVPAALAAQAAADAEARAA